MTNLLQAMDDWTKAIEFGQGQVLRWLKALLTGRRHRVSVEGELSGCVYAKSGITQGSVLGPIFFVIFINYLLFAINNCCKLSADDTKLYRTIKTEDDTTSLQDDINRLVN